MNRGLLLLTILFLGCDPTYDVHHFPQDTEVPAPVADTDTAEPDCFGVEACTANTIKECWLDAPNILRIWGAPGSTGCICVNGVQIEMYRDQMCEHGCQVNPSGHDYCIEETI